MKFIISSLLIALICSQTDCKEDCPLWTTQKNGTCRCNSPLKNIVQCQDMVGATSLTKCFCMTTDANSTLPLVGSCPYTCGKIGSTAYHIHLKTDRSEELNNKTCGPFHRTGVLCSKCREGYGLPVYSYNLSCVECKDYKYNWIKYIAVAYGPLTLFYLLAITFRVSATSGLMICYVTICQMATIRGLVSWLDNLNPSHWLIKVLISTFSIWNLDFFRAHYSPFCLCPHMSAIQVLLLDYLVAVYPLGLILLTYSLVKLHDKYAPTLCCCCKPLYKCFRKFRKEWDIKTSIVGLFATFYLLSYVKVINVTADVLTPTYLYNGSDFKYANWSFFYNASIQYLGEEHLPYAVFAVVFSLLFNLLPLLLLCLYPCACFHKCLNKTTCRCHTLHIFMDAMLGSFSHKPRERRYFAAIYLMMRIFHVVIFAGNNFYSYFTGASFSILGYIVLVAAFKPHKRALHNVIDIILLSATAIMYLFIVCQGATSVLDPLKVFRVQDFVYRGFVVISELTLTLYGTSVVISNLLPWRFIKNATDKAKLKIRMMRCNPENSEEDTLLEKRLPQFC